MARPLLAIQLDIPEELWPSGGNTDTEAENIAQYVVNVVNNALVASRPSGEQSFDDPRQIGKKTLRAEWLEEDPDGEEQ